VCGIWPGAGGEAEDAGPAHWPGAFSFSRQVLFEIVGWFIDLCFLSFPYLKYFLQCWVSGMFIPDPDSYTSRISDPEPNKIRREEETNKFVNFFVATNFTKLSLFYFWWTGTKKNSGNWLRTIVVGFLPLFRL
jgi:hypothetical protein